MMFYKVLNMDIFSYTNASIRFRRPLLTPQSSVEHCALLNFFFKSTGIAIIKIGKLGHFYFK